MIITLYVLAGACGWLAWQLANEITERQAAEAAFETLRYDYLITLQELKSKRMVAQRVAAQRDGAYARIRQLIKERGYDH